MKFAATMNRLIQGLAWRWMMLGLAIGLTLHSISTPVMATSYHPPFAITAPPAGSVLSPGQSVNVQWTGGNPLWSVNVSLVEVAPGPFVVRAGVAAGIPNSGSVLWTLPTTLPFGEDPCGRNFVFYVENVAVTSWIYGPVFSVSCTPEIATTIAPEPGSITLSTAAIPSNGTYRVTLTPAAGKTFDLVSFTATTQVVDNEGGVVVPPQYAAFVAPVPPDCTIGASPFTTISCNFGAYASASPMVFTLVVSAPLATTPTPFPGDRIKLTSQTSWDEAGGSVYIESALSDPAYTLLTEPDPSKFATFLPLATGGRVSTGTTQCTAANGCTATNAEPFITVANVPISTLVSIDQTKPTEGLGSLPKDLYTDFRIPGIFGVPPEPVLLTTFSAGSGSGGPVLEVTLRKHKSKIGSGTGSLIDALQILKQKVYYHGETTNGVLSAAGPVPVYLCLITGGPVAATATQPGRPCISEVRVYSKFNAPSQPALWGTFQWKLRFKSNGRVTVR
jgi:hypothetical protein